MSLSGVCVNLLELLVFAFICLCLRDMLELLVFAFICLCLRDMLELLVFAFICWVRLCLSGVYLNMPEFA